MDLDERQTNFCIFYFGMASTDPKKLQMKHQPKLFWTSKKPNVLENRALCVSLKDPL